MVARTADLEGAEDAVRDKQEELQQKEQELTRKREQPVQGQQALEAAQRMLAEGQERLQVSGSGCCAAAGVAGTSMVGTWWCAVVHGGEWCSTVHDRCVMSSALASKQCILSSSFKTAYLLLPIVITTNYAA